MSRYRPRGALSRAILHKFQNDAENFEQIDSWYKMESLPVASEYQKTFIPFEADQRTMAWLEQSKETSSNTFLQLWYIVAKFFLSIFMTQTDLNGFLARGSMFILSEDQIGTILNKSGFRLPAHGAANILDIGAGDGHCTARIQNALKQMEGSSPHILVTETSWIMRKRLAKYDNFSLVEVPDVKNLSNLHLVTCLNVLDRCDDPHQMLSDIHNILHPDGRAMFALVLPYYHFVESNSSHLPVRPLLPHWPNNYSRGSNESCDCSEHHCEYRKRRPSFGEETRIFFDVLKEHGFKVDAWTKAPYLCEGDIRQSFYWLIDIVVVVSKVKVTSSSSGEHQVN